MLISGSCTHPLNTAVSPSGLFRLKEPFGRINPILNWPKSCDFLALERYLSRRMNPPLTRKPPPPLRFALRSGLFSVGSAPESIPDCEDTPAFANGLFVIISF